MLDAGTDVVVAGIDGHRAARTAAALARDAQRRGATLRLVHAVVAQPAGIHPEPRPVGLRVTDHALASADRFITW